MVPALEKHNLLREISAHTHEANRENFRTRNLLGTVHTHKVKSTNSPSFFLGD